jgi:hypothetical protein
VLAATSLIGAGVTLLRPRHKAAERETELAGRRALAEEAAR